MHTIIEYIGSAIGSCKNMYLVKTLNNKIIFYALRWEKDHIVRSKMKNRRNRGKLDTPNTHIHDPSISCTSIKSGGFNLVLFYLSLLVKF